MKRIVDFVLIFLLVYLTVGIFMKDDSKPNLTGAVLLTTSSNDYSIPASVILTVKNSTPDAIEFDTCGDITLKKLWEVIDFSGADFCKKEKVLSWGTATIDYKNYYNKFDAAWEYYFQAKIGKQEPIASFEVSHRWAISKIFIAFVYEPILNLMDYLIKNTGYSLGWAILITTIIVRIILLWPQHKMMVSQRKLQAIQPKIKEIQDKNKGNQQQMWMDLMALYKKEKVNPMWSCGFLLIQMPILFVLYNVILEIRDPSNLYYLYAGLQDFQVDKIISNFYWMELFATWMDKPLQWVLLWLAVWWVQYLQVKLSLWDKLKETKKWAVLEQKKWKKWYESMMPDPDMMNKFMLYWMPAMVVVFTFTFFAWLWLYWGASTVFMIFQQLVVNKITKKHMKK